MKIAVVIPTYRRPDGSTEKYLSRCIASVMNQSHIYFRIYLMGDRYENVEEFNRVAKTFASNRLHAENLPTAYERDNFSHVKGWMWGYGGCATNNTGIDRALNDGFDYICHLDHDDWWEPNHLQLLSRCIEETGAAWLHTKSTYLYNRTLPDFTFDGDWIEGFPQATRAIHSSMCYDLRRIPFRYPILKEHMPKSDDFGGWAADIDMINTISRFIESKPHLGLRSFLVNAVTCHHDEEGYALQ